MVHLEMFNNFCAVRKYFTFEHVYGVTKSMDKNKIVMIAPVAVAGILMLAVLAAISSTNQAFAAEPTKLTLAVSMGTRVPVNERVPITLSGRLTSDDSPLAGVAGATISFSCDKEPCGRPVTTTGLRGHYSVAASLSATPPKSTSTIEASTQKTFCTLLGCYEGSEASLTVPLCENPPGYWSVCGRPPD
jgi:hypothetical protein